MKRTNNFYERAAAGGRERKERKPAARGYVTNRIQITLKALQKIIITEDSDKSDLLVNMLAWDCCVCIDNNFYIDLQTVVTNEGPVGKRPNYFGYDRTLKFKLHGGKSVPMYVRCLSCKVSEEHIITCDDLFFYVEDYELPRDKSLAAHERFLQKAILDDGRLELPDADDPLLQAFLAQVGVPATWTNPLAPPAVASAGVTLAEQAAKLEKYLRFP